MDNKIIEKSEVWVIMRIPRRSTACLCLALFLLLMTGCVKKTQSTQKQNDLLFTVIDQSEAPEEFQEVIEKNKEKPFRLTYADQGDLYIAEGYGAQKKTGYSVTVTELYETEDAVYIHTNLMGPEKGEETKEITTYPYVVIKTQDTDKTVMFDGQSMK